MCKGKGYRVTTRKLLSGLHSPVAHMDLVAVGVYKILTHDQGEKNYSLDGGGITEFHH